jgi:hypothetical protein
MGKGDRPKTRWKHERIRRKKRREKSQAVARHASRTATA